MKSVFVAEDINNILNRIEKLDKNTQPNWGKLTIGQMLWHCQGPLNIMLEHDNYNLKPNFLAKLFFKKSLYNDKAWKKNLPTAKFLKPKESKVFKTEKAKLKALIEESYTLKDKTDFAPHPGFGVFTPEQWGKMQYKHLDHHFRQFGV
ncbi:DUF1569 domain-containing protein [Olleya sp. R77988]|uniref:DUF1569 domain-containing protein n=1 Tax=Olleya sp. R77988 TaxID=3093875 RepID=UPI0037CB0DFD